METAGVAYERELVFSVPSHELIRHVTKRADADGGAETTAISIENIDLGC